jgi:uncharacterized protein (TIGR03086 family)
MDIGTLERALGVARSTLANVRPDAYGDPTPCASWNVGRLVTHLVGATYWFADSVDTGIAPTGEDDRSEELDVTPDGALRAFDEGAGRAVAAFSAPGALDRVVRLPFGDMPAGVFLALAVNDVFTHAWDLAKATGQPTDLAPDIAGELLGIVKMAVGPEFRGPDGSGAPFGPEVAVSPSAPLADQLAAFLGRTP